MTNTRDSTVSFEGMKRSVRLESLTFMTSKDVQKLLSTGITFRSVIKGKVNFASEITFPDIKFSIYMQTASCPVGSIQLPRKHGTTKLASEVASRSNVRATKAGTDNIKMADDKYDCFIAGIAVTNSGKRLFADNNNFKVKMFSQDMTFLSSVSLRGSPWDITMINDREAVVTTGDGNELVFLTVSDRQLSITEIIKLPYKVLGIAKAKDNFVVASARSMMKIDRRGKECWSVTNGGQGQRLFDNARYVCCYSDGRSVAVTDHGQNTLTVLDVNTGNIINSCRVEQSRKYILGLTVDASDNLYICGFGQVLVMSGDLKETRVLTDMVKPQAIAFDDIRRQLLVSCGGNNDAHCLQLS